MWTSIYLSDSRIYRKYTFYSMNNIHISKSLSTSGNSQLKVYKHAKTKKQAP